MKRINYFKGAILVAASSLVIAGCTVRERTTYSTPSGEVAVDDGVEVDTAPPAPLAETVTVAPGPDYVWIGGVWGWGGGRWNWERGHWAHPPHPGAVWAPHRYVERGGRHVFVRGRWH